VPYKSLEIYQNMWHIRQLTLSNVAAIDSLYICLFSIYASQQHFSLLRLVQE